MAIEPKGVLQMTKPNVLETKQEEVVVDNRAMRFYIAGRNNITGRVYLNMGNNGVQYNEYEATVADTVKGSTAINALAVMTRTMQQIKDMKENNVVFTEPIVIYTLGMVSDQITRGTFKYWVASGKRNSGQELPEVEMNLWKEFTALYQDLFLDVIIKNISSASVPKKSKYPISKQQRNDDKIVGMLWDKIPASSIQKLEETKTDALSAGSDIVPF